VVEKTHFNNKTITTLRYVSGNERVEILAKMISGEHVTQEALHQAKKLLQYN
jgi:DNA repair ATPase RecN